MIRPTDNEANDEFWIAIAGSHIDWQKLSTSPEHFIDGVRKLSGLHSLEVSETMTLNYYRYVSSHSIYDYLKLSYGPTGLTYGWRIRSERGEYSLLVVRRLHSPQLLPV